MYHLKKRDGWASIVLRWANCRVLNDDEEFVPLASSLEAFDCTPSNLLKVIEVLLTTVVVMCYFYFIVILITNFDDGSM